MKALAALLLFAGPAFAAPQLAWTFDDLPAHAPMPPGVTRVEIAKTIIDALHAAGVTSATGFVNGALLQGEPDSLPVLKMWRDAGFPLGNHTWSHPGLSKLSVADYQAEILRNEPLLTTSSPNADWHWFRYPYLDEGDTVEKRAAIRSFLASRGYKIGTVTMTFDDWAYSEPYARCAAKNDSASIARMEMDYFAAAEDSITYYRKLSNALYGRDIPYVLLMHLGAFEARTMPRLLALYRAKAFAFVSLEQAMRDPYYAPFTDPGLPAPPIDLEHAAEAAKLPPIPERKDSTAALEKVCR